MDFKARILPTQEELEKAHANTSLSSDDIAAISFIINFLNSASIMKDRLNNDLQKNHNLSEGRFLLLVTLKSQDKPMCMGKLSRRLGISNATLSVMVKRMLKDKIPLIKKEINEKIKSSYYVSLTPKGYELIEEVLPSHFKEVEKIANILEPQERKLMFDLVTKLQKSL